MESWLLELARGVGRLFLHPFLYVFIIGNVTVGYLRVKRERKNFSSSIHDMFYELRNLLGYSIGLGLSLSLISVGIGLVVPINFIILMSIGTVLFSIVSLFRLTSPTYIVPFAMLVAFLLEGRGVSLFGYDLGGVDQIGGLVGIVVALLLAETFLLKMLGKKLSAPMIVDGKRGKPIGIHFVKRLWLVPLFLLIPIGDITSFASWWPIFGFGNGSYGLFLVPFSIGVVQQMKGTVPKEYITLLSVRVRLLALVVLLLAVVTYWVNWLGYVALGVALIGRIFIDVQAATSDKSKGAYFSERNDGLVVVGIIPHSPADKMGIKVGEIVKKVNGLPVSSARNYYEALQENRAFCKLEVDDLNGELRIVQSALYEGEHYELGLLYVQG